MAPPSVPKKRKVHLPANEELAGKVLEKHRSMMAEESGGISEHRAVCLAKEPFRTPADLSRIKYAFLHLSRLNFLYMERALELMWQTTFSKNVDVVSLYYSQSAFHIQIGHQPQRAAATVICFGAVGLIFMIIQAAATAQENMVKLEQVAGRVYMSFKTVNTIISSFLDNLVPAPNNRGKTTTEGAETKKFTLEEMTAVTDNFAVVLGQGDSGKVYKGKLQDGREVAVKRLKDGLRRAEDTFGTELALHLHPLSLSHDHIVRLVGWCAEEGERMLVYEHMDKGTLRDHLNKASPSWITRIQVLLGAARAIGHLHRHAVIHCNLTSSNILLDRSLVPRVSGFGASVCREAPGGVLSQQDVVHRTYGYADPELEYYITGHLKPATDVYSFGVVMLEVLTGKQPVVATTTSTDTMLVPWALPSIQAGKLGDVLDRRPASEPSPRQREALHLVAGHRGKLFVRTWG
uniref:Uncharacterized protein n=1 Tax=Avena sativa TaxID=4498 RepID=A0ACD5XKF2_AVESA